MAEATTSIVITGKDATGQAFASVNSSLAGLSSQAIKATSALGAIGAGAALTAMASFAKQTIDAQDELFKLSQKTGIAVESLAGLEFAAEQSGVELEKVASATRKFSLLVAESADASGESAKKLQALGLEYKSLKDLSPEKQLLALADALQQFSKEDRAVALTSLLGNKMADLIPLLSGGSKGLSELIDQGKKLNPVTEESARKSEQFNDQLNLLNKTVSSLGREMVQGLIPGLSRITNEMVKATEQGGFLTGVMAGVKQLFVESFGNPKILGDVGQIRREILKTEEAITKLSSNKDSIFFDKNALAHEQEKLGQLQVDLQKALGTSRDFFKTQSESTEGTKKFAVVVDDSSKALKNRTDAQDELNKAQAESLRRESEYIKLLVIERKQREEFLRPYKQEAQAAEDRLTALNNEQQALKLSRDREISLEKAIELTTIARLEEKKVITSDSEAVNQINREIDARKRMVSVIEEKDARNASEKIRQQELQAYEQFSIQAARNIQTNLAFGIQEGFRNGFKSGIKGLLGGIANTVSQVVSEVLAARLLKSSGIGSALGLFGSGSSVASGAGGGKSVFDIASLGSNALSLARGGFGLTGLVGSGVARLGGLVGSSSLSAFGGGLAGTSAGVFSAAGGAGTAFIGGAGTAIGGTGMGAAASMGASFASVAGPAIALAAVDAIGRVFAGDKKLGGAEMIPVLGGFLAGLFGHGPMKFRQQSLQGSITDGGFDGDLTNVFRAKGGLLVGNKHKSVSQELSQDMQLTLDTALTGFYKSTHDFASNLGLNVGLVDNFTKDIQIKSEKGKTITQEAISEMLSGISDEIVRNVLPTVDAFRKLGETSTDTFSRLNNEFVALERGAENLGASAEYARQLILGLSIDARTALVDQAGGTDALLSSTQFFFDNFLSGGEKLDLMSNKLSKSLTDLGLSSDITIQQFKELVQNVDTSNDLRLSLLKLAPAFLEVRNAVQEATDSSREAARALVQNNLNNAFAGLQRSTDNERKRLNDNYTKSLTTINSRISDITKNVERLTNLKNALKSALETLNPVSLTDARKKVQDAINKVRSGGNVDLDSLKGSIDKLSQSDSSGFSTRSEFLLSQARNASLLNGLGDATDKQLSVEEKSLRVLEDQRDDLEVNFTRQLESLDDLLGKAQEQISAINGVDTSIKSLFDAIKDFNKSSYNAGGGAIGSGVSTGNPGISGQEIFAFTRSHSPMETYLKAKQLGVSSDQIVRSGAYTRKEIDDWLKANKLASFDVGGMVPKTGLALIHKGEQILNPKQRDAIIETLERLIQAVSIGAGSSRDTYKLLRNMTNDGLSLKTVAA